MYTRVPVLRTGTAIDHHLPICTMELKEETSNSQHQKDTHEIPTKLLSGNKRNDTME